MIWDISSDERIKQVINQASKSWVIPDGYRVFIYDIGEPNTDKHPAYEHSGNIGYYLDVASGKLYGIETVVEPNGGVKSKWVYAKQLTSVQSELEAMKTVKTGTIGHPITTGSYSREVLQKKDGIVYISCMLSGASLTSYTTVWATLPDGFKPKTNVYVIGYANINGTYRPLPILIDIYGRVQQSYGAIEATEVFIFGSFIAAE